MAAFGVSFPKITLSRPSLTKVDADGATAAAAATSSTTTTTAKTTITVPTARTLSLSIKNVPSQPLHYDVSTTTAATKKKSQIAALLAIDGESKQLPKNLSVFDEFHFGCDAGDVDEKRRLEREHPSNGVLVSLSPIETTDRRPDTLLCLDIDSKKILYNPKQQNYDEEKRETLRERRSNHTFTPPTSSTSNESSSNDLHLTSSSFSVDSPHLNYAIEKFLVDDDEPVYSVAKEFQSGTSLVYQDRNGNAHDSHTTTSDLMHSQQNSTELRLLNEKSSKTDERSRPRGMSSSTKWYVSELRINRPLIYRTYWTNGPRCSNRKLSHSVNDLKQIAVESDRRQDCKNGTIDNIARSTLSLQNFDSSIPSQRLRSDGNVLTDGHRSCTEEDVSNLQSDRNEQRSTPPAVRRVPCRSTRKNDTLIANESIKKKLFDILNDDELENACLEDMGREFGKMSLVVDRDGPVASPFSASSDDALYPSNDDALRPPLPLLPPLSSSYDGNLSTSVNHAAGHNLSRSRLITTSLDKIPSNNNAYSSSPLLQLSYQPNRPSWYTSPLPQWRTEDQSSPASISTSHSSEKDDHPDRFLRTKVTEFALKEKKYLQKYNRHHRKEQKHVTYSTTIADNSSSLLPRIKDKSSNLLMFI